MTTIWTENNGYGEEYTPKVKADERWFDAELEKDKGDCEKCKGTGLASDGYGLKGMKGEADSKSNQKFRNLKLRNQKRPRGRRGEAVCKNCKGTGVKKVDHWNRVRAGDDGSWRTGHHRPEHEFNCPSCDGLGYDIPDEEEEVGSSFAFSHAESKANEFKYSILNDNFTFQSLSQDYLTCNHCGLDIFSTYYEELGGDVWGVEGEKKAVQHLKDKHGITESKEEHDNTVWSDFHGKWIDAGVLKKDRRARGFASNEVKDEFSEDAYLQLINDSYEVPMEFHGRFYNSAEEWKEQDPIAFNESYLAWIDGNEKDGIDTGHEDYELKDTGIRGYEGRPKD